MRTWGLSVGMAMVLLGCHQSPQSTQSTSAEVALEKVADGFEQPLLITHAGDGSGRLYVVEQGGRIFTLNRTGGAKTLFLDVSGLLNAQGAEQGLLALAFHPQFEDNGVFFIWYTAQNGDNTLARLRARDQHGDITSLEELIRITDPASNHNGGTLAFGPDGYLYFGTGDGGSAGDPWNHAQSLDAMLGKLHRINVNQPSGYAIPPDNPFVNDPRARPEIWAYGLRNPWRFSFDRDTGELWIADVGQKRWEEVNHAIKDIGGQNYGWKIMEGRHCFSPETDCNPQGLTLPVAEYNSDQGCSIIGGYVYRGSTVPALRGKYIFGDYCSGIVWGVTHAHTDYFMAELLRTDYQISSFGEDEAGELYLVDHGGGAIYRFVKK